MQAHHRKAHYSRTQAKAVALAHNVSMKFLMALSGAAFILFCLAKA